MAANYATVTKRRSAKCPPPSYNFNWSDNFTSTGVLCTSVFDLNDYKDKFLATLGLKVAYSYDPNFTTGPQIRASLSYMAGKSDQLYVKMTINVWKNLSESNATQIRLCSMNFETGSKLLYRNQLLSASVPYDRSTNAIQQADFQSYPTTQVQVSLTVCDHDPLTETETEPTLQEAMKNLCSLSEMSDVTIVCDGHQFPCHKLILSLRSHVFKRMFSSDLKINEKDEATLEIIDISAETMKAFLNFIYTDELKAEEITTNLLFAADKYDVKRLTNICLKHFENEINTENVMDITSTAFFIDNQGLLQKASEFIFKNRGKIKKCESWHDIREKYPKIAAKVMDLIVFESEDSNDPQDEELASASEVSEESESEG